MMSNACIPNSLSFWAIWGNWSSWGGARFVPNFAPPSETQLVTDGQSINLNLPAMRPSTPSQIPYTYKSRHRIECNENTRNSIQNFSIYMYILPYRLDRYNSSQRNELPRSCRKTVILYAWPPTYNDPVIKPQVTRWKPTRCIMQRAWEAERSHFMKPHIK